jgi:hypothetical protein
MALKEAIKSEDQRRLEFIAWKLKQDTRSLPLNIMKFIGSLKKSVRETIRNKGGTPFSIVRELIVYWDTDKTGQISAEEMQQLNYQVDNQVKSVEESAKSFLQSKGLIKN